MRRRTRGISPNNIAIARKPVGGIVGSRTASNFIRDMMNGVDSVDILFVGDSNTDYSAHGYVTGMGNALQQSGARCYGTMVYPVYQSASQQDIGHKCNMSPLRNADAFGSGGTATVGASSGKTSLINLFGRTSGTASPTGDAGLDFIYVSGTPSGNGYQQTIAGVYVDTDNPIGIKNELRYRVLRSQMPSGDTPGTFYLASQTASATITTSSAITTTGSYAWVASEHTVPANPSATMSEHHFAWKVGAALGVYNNVGFAAQSVYRAVKGWSVGCLHYRGGESMTTVASNISGWGATKMGTYLKEVRDRQIAAGGTGRVIVWVQGGVNTATGLPGSWETDLATMKTAITSAWTGSGGSAENITFVANVSHQYINPDSSSSGSLNVLSGQRATAKAMIGGANGSNLTVVTLTEQITYPEMVPLYDGGGAVHLTAAGYNEICLRAFSNLVRY